LYGLPASNQQQPEPGKTCQRPQDLTTSEEKKETQDLTTSEEKKATQDLTTSEEKKETQDLPD
jgi:hypothetical protein